jgi:hypothetical protein
MSSTRMLSSAVRPRQRWRWRRCQPYRRARQLLMMMMVMMLRWRRHPPRRQLLTHHPQGKPRGACRWC